MIRSRETEKNRGPWTVSSSQRAGDRGVNKRSFDNAFVRTLIWTPVPKIHFAHRRVYGRVLEKVQILFKEVIFFWVYVGVTYTLRIADYPNPTAHRFRKTSDTTNSMFRTRRPDRIIQTTIFSSTSWKFSFSILPFGSTSNPIIWINDKGVSKRYKIQPKQLCKN